MYFSTTIFNEGCAALVDVWNSVRSNGDDQANWENAQIRNGDQQYLRIARRLVLHSSTQDPANSSTLEVNADHRTQHTIVEDESCKMIDLEDDEDCEAICKRPVTGNEESILVIYDIIFSISYQSPVVYMTFSASTGAPWVPSLDFVYLHVVPSSHKSILQAPQDYGAPFGGLSISDHPITNTPAFFVHPCRTTEALASLTDTAETLGAAEKLLKFIGVIGNSVGLVAPTSVAVEVIRRCRSPNVP